MEKKNVYKNFIAWMKNAPPVFPDSAELTDLIKARYTPEDAALLTGMPFNYMTIEELAERKGIAVEDLKPRMDALSKKGVVWKIFQHGAYRYRLCDLFLVFYRSVYWGGGRNSEHYVMAPLLNKARATCTRKGSSSAPPNRDSTAS